MKKLLFLSAFLGVSWCARSARPPVRDSAALQERFIGPVCEEIAVGFLAKTDARLRKILSEDDGTIFTVAFVIDASTAENPLEAAKSLREEFRKVGFQIPEEIATLPDPAGGHVLQVKIQSADDRELLVFVLRKTKSIRFAFVTEYLVPEKFTIEEKLAEFLAAEPRAEEPTELPADVAAEFRRNVVHDVMIMRVNVEGSVIKVEFTDVRPINRRRQKAFPQKFVTSRGETYTIEETCTGATG